MRNRNAGNAAFIAWVAIATLASPLARAQQPAPVIVVDPNTQQGAQPYPTQDPNYAQQPVMMQPQPDPMMQAQPVMVEPFSLPRLRAGVTVFGGPAIPGGSGSSAGGFGGASGRLGIQINRMWGVYYHLQASIGGYVYASDTAAIATVFAAAYNTVAGSVTLADRLEFAFGPSLDSFALVSASVDSGSTGGSSAKALALAGTGFGLHGRISIACGRMYPELMRRSGFAISLDLHPTFFDGGVLFTAAIGLGAEWY